MMDCWDSKLSCFHFQSTINSWRRAGGDMTSNLMTLDNNKLEDIAQALRNYATLLTTEAERQEIFGSSSSFDLFEKAGVIWGLSEDVEACKRFPPKRILQLKELSPNNRKR